MSEADTNTYPPVRKAYATDRPAAFAPTDDLGFAQVRPTRMSAILLALSACSAESRSQLSAVPQNTAEQSYSLDGFTTDVESGWTGVAPDLVFASDSQARSLPRPPGLAGASFGYYGDTVMTRQYSRNQLAKMRKDRASFVMARDLDGDGVVETYRTGFWRIGDARTGDAREGSFLAVVDPGRPPQVIDSTSKGYDTGVFISGAGRNLDLSWCNCPAQGTIGYEGKRLSVRWADR